jgi:catechol 2,3-dioxygenase-like lactoylglutathione lyase family enzyme
MPIQRLDHVTIQTRDVQATRDFYVGVLGLTEGDRPPFNFPGLWLYNGSAPVIHVIGLDAADSLAPGTGAIDHIAFRVDGLSAMRDRLAQSGLMSEERFVPRTGDIQLFVTDPSGVKIELNFTAAPAPAAPELTKVR